MADQMLENAQFATRKRQRPAADLGVPAVEENADQAGCRFVGAAAGSPANDRGANQDLANVNRDVDDIVDPGLEQFDGVLKLFQVVEGDDRRPRPVANALRNAGAVRAVTQEKCADRHHVIADGAFQPVAKFLRREADRNNALAVKPGCIAACYAFPVIDDDEHVVPLFA